MIHHENKSAITPELEAEFQAAVRQAMSSRRDPEAMRRAPERMDRVREETSPLKVYKAVFEPKVTQDASELGVGVVFVS